MYYEFLDFSMACEYEQKWKWMPKKFIICKRMCIEISFKFLFKMHYSKRMFYETVKL